MKASEFRKLALSFPTAVEGVHMGTTDFRVTGKIFATLGYPNPEFGALMLSPADQDLLLKQYPKAFTPAPGAWGRTGSTLVRLTAVTRRAVKLGLESAWARRASKTLRTTYANAGRTRPKSTVSRRTRTG